MNEHNIAEKDIREAIKKLEKYKLDPQDPLIRYSSVLYLIEEERQRIKDNLYKYLPKEYSSQFIEQAFKELDEEN